MFLPTGEGAPSKNEGVGGVFHVGSGEEFPSGFGQRPRFMFCHIVVRRSRQASQTPIYFDALASKYV
ncbi:hypothetical protein CN448_10310 [Bacillus cereus]|nr:hypothetical protein CN448_10310 [Bacillus cereus]